jgi:hypothetical protein
MPERSTALPRGEFFERQAIAFAGLVDGQQATVDRSDHFRLAPHHPACGVGRAGCPASAVRPRANNLRRPDFLVFDHGSFSSVSYALRRGDGLFGFITVVLPPFCHSLKSLG